MLNLHNVNLHRLRGIGNCYIKKSILTEGRISIFQASGTELSMFEAINNKRTDGVNLR